MGAIPPNINLDGFITSMKQGVEGVFNRGVKYGRYLEQQERPAPDAVPRDEYDALLRRFQHLLESDYIRSFDAYDPQTGTYKRDISEAVEKVIRCKDCRHWGRSPFDHASIGWCIIAGYHRNPDYYCASADVKNDPNR